MSVKFWTADGHALSGPHGLKKIFQVKKRRNKKKENRSTTLYGGEKTKEKCCTTLSNIAKRKGIGHTTLYGRRTMLSGGRATNWHRGDRVLSEKVVMLYVFREMKRTARVVYGGIEFLLLYFPFKNTPGPVFSSVFVGIYTFNVLIPIELFILN
jgi:hypothetical protein